MAVLTKLEYLYLDEETLTAAMLDELDVRGAVRYLYLDEETLTAAAFEFAGRLPKLVRLGLQDVPISVDELEGYAQPYQAFAWGDRRR